MDDLPRPRADVLRWSSWQRATQIVLARVAAEVATATGLSESDFAVLSRVQELGSGSLRQGLLAQSLGWSRARTSTHLNRMEGRGLVSRASAGNSVVVRLTELGRQELAEASVVHEAAVRRHLLDPLDPLNTGQLAVLDVALTRWSSPEVIPGARATEGGGGMPSVVGGRPQRGQDVLGVQLQHEVEEVVDGE